VIAFDKSISLFESSKRFAASLALLTPEKISIPTNTKDKAAQKKSNSKRLKVANAMSMQAWTKLNADMVIFKSPIILLNPLKL
jgi:hypothetical protein